MKEILKGETGVKSIRIETIACGMDRIVLPAGIVTFMICDLCSDSR